MVCWFMLFCILVNVGVFFSGVRGFCGVYR